MEKELGIIMLDTKFPRIKGDVGNEESFFYPVRKKIVKGADPSKIVLNPDYSLLYPFIEAAQELESEGVSAITTSCGFLTLFHNELSEAVDIPVLSSSLLQAKLIYPLLKKNQKIGIVTANAEKLGERHFKAIGIENIPKAVYGMEETYFGNVFVQNEPELDPERAEKDMVEVVNRMLSEHKDIGGILLECTNMPPYKHALKEITDLPIFDIITLCDYVMEAC